MGKPITFKIDEKNRCIDRSSPEGQLLDACQSIADNNDDSSMSAFMSQVIAYTDVSAFVDQTMDRKQARVAMGKLKARMDNDVSVKS